MLHTINYTGHELFNWITAIKQRTRPRYFCNRQNYVKDYYYYMSLIVLADTDIAEQFLKNFKIMCTNITLLILLRLASSFMPLSI